MNDNGKQVEYNSADIRKKPKEILVKNTRDYTTSEKIQRFYKSGLLKLILLGILAVLAVTVFSVMVGASLNRESGTPAPSSSEGQGLAQIYDDVDSLDNSTSGEDKDALLASIDARLETARSNNDSDMVYVLLIAKSDAYINLGLYEFAADDLLEAYNVDRDNAPHAFEVFSRIIKCYAAISDKENEKLFLEQIIALPNSAFPQRTDEEFKAYYVNQLENLK